MSVLNFNPMNRRVFLKASALWGTAAALHVPPVTPAFAQSRKEGEYDAIVIGAGLGGLTFARYMAKQVFKVLVLEHSGVPGGYATLIVGQNHNSEACHRLRQALVASSVEGIGRVRNEKGGL